MTAPRTHLTDLLNVRPSPLIVGMVAEAAATDAAPTQERVSAGRDNVRLALALLAEGNTETATLLLTKAADLLAA